ncbi:hypothetical protein CONPUDRAFT_169374 [Coniophora puteana RWD-64-598 SS2]|uniref:Uncharacterized protein n=1 Tax=Coniophora puteana (strain RWD-64-598) TaxID=741705 RepID=A0A5M3MA98_CONPW|nr:uncharacterized protein CONPUDRAFT_169374 [Coniophora puteana RWD-64-598 SS2]EIW75571.1 hypothetical protein CONPUDRAFT_169374 [Coniophora puteana RWD-64-598 SS2]
MSLPLPPGVPVTEESWHALPVDQKAAWYRHLGLVVVDPVLTAQEELERRRRLDSRWTTQYHDHSVDGPNEANPYAQRDQPRGRDVQRSPNRNSREGSRWPSRSRRRHRSDSLSSAERTKSPPRRRRRTQTETRPRAEEAAPAAAVSVESTIDNTPMGPAPTEVPLRGTDTLRGRGGRSGRRGGRPSALERRNQDGSRAGMYDEDAIDVCTEKLTPGPAKNARNKLFRLIKPAFRKRCGVMHGERWPNDQNKRTDAARGIDYVTPLFSAPVDDARNEPVLSAIVQQAWDNITSKTLPDDLMDRKVKWNKASLETLVKVTWSGMRTEWKRQNDPAAQKRSKMSDQRGRWTGRRQQKAEKLEEPAIIEAYFDLYKADPSPVIHEDFMSDEASGPEDEEVESKHQWKVRMAEKLALPTCGDAFAALRFFEVLRPAWRSEEMSLVFEKLRELRRTVMSAKESETAIVIRVYGTDRVSPRLPEKMEPWNFGINMEWYEANKERVNLGRWTKWGDPTGFGEKKQVEGQNEEVGVGEGGGAGEGGGISEGGTGEVGEGGGGNTSDGGDMGGNENEGVTANEGGGTSSGEGGSVN